MIGIYKIESPTGKIYIGQSVNILNRFSLYIRLQCKSQSRLYNSFLKHGVDIHNFDIVEECNVEKLNEKERYWQDFYDVTGRNGLNCRLTKTEDKSGYMSEESRKKLSKTKTGLKQGPRTEQAKQNIKNGTTGIKKGPQSESHRKLNSLTKLGIPKSESHKESMKQPKSNLHRKNLKVSANTLKTCPHCKVECKPSVAGKYHFGKCKLLLGI